MILVTNLLDTHGNGWDFQSINWIWGSHMCSYLARLSSPAEGKIDFLFWTYNSKGNFNTKLTYRELIFKCSPVSSIPFGRNYGTWKSVKWLNFSVGDYSLIVFLLDLIYLQECIYMIFFALVSICPWNC